MPRYRCRRLGAAAHCYLFVRRLAVDAPARWGGLLRCASPEALETLALDLLDHPGARARPAEIYEDFQALARFFESEACARARARASTGYSR